MNDINNQSTDLIGDTYANYLKKRTTSNKDNIRVPHTLENGMTGQISRPYTQEEFINKIKTDEEFAKKWDVIVEVRELSMEERTQILVSRSDNKRDFYDRNSRLIIEEKLVLDESKIPTKAISLTYNNQTIENYE
jgi:hypothetical protein